jgi:MIP family channel proteins
MTPKPTDPTEPSEPAKPAGSRRDAGQASAVTARDPGPAHRGESDPTRASVPAFIAEFLGTFLLVFFVTAVVSVNSEDGLRFTDFAVIGLVHVFVLAMLIYTLAGTSGAHFNPAVTAALAAVRKISPADAVIYWLVQLSGGVLGALVTKLLLLDEGRGVSYGATTVSEQFLQGKALPGLLVEVIGTFVLMWAIMGLAVNPEGERNFGGLIIGATLGFAVMVLAPLSGAGFNPARSFGPAIVSGEFADFWIYVVGPLLGALIAAVGYRALVLRPKDEPGLRPIDTLE